MVLTPDLFTDVSQIIRKLQKDGNSGYVVLNLTPQFGGLVHCLCIISNNKYTLHIFSYSCISCYWFFCWKHHWILFDIIFMNTFYVHTLFVKLFIVNHHYNRCMVLWTYAVTMNLCCHFDSLIQDVPKKCTCCLSHKKLRWPHNIILPFHDFVWRAKSTFLGHYLHLIAERQALFSSRAFRHNASAHCTHIRFDI